MIRTVSFDVSIAIHKDRPAAVRVEVRGDDAATAPELSPQMAAGLSTMLEWASKEVSRINAERAKPIQGEAA